MAWPVIRFNSRAYILWD